MLVGHYHLVAYTLRSLGVQREPGVPGFDVSELRRVTEGGTRLAAGRVLVVGAGTQPSDDPEAPVGNGRAIAVLAAREGASVICADRDRAAAEETAAWIERERGTATVVVADVSSEEQCAELTATAAAEGFDGLVLNVGIGRGQGLAGTTARRLGHHVRGERPLPLPRRARGAAASCRRARRSSSSAPSPVCNRGAACPRTTRRRRRSTASAATSPSRAHAGASAPTSSHQG